MVYKELMQYVWNNHPDVIAYFIGICVLLAGSITALGLMTKKEKD